MPNQRLVDDKILLTINICLVMQQLLPNDKNMLISCSTGNQVAFEKLFETYRMKIYATSYKITRSQYASEEIVQEVFVDLWERRMNLGKVDKPSGYIFKVAYHKIYNYLRKADNDRRLLRAFAHKTENDRHNNTEDWINCREIQGLIDQAVEKLPPMRKLVYKLSREEGLNNKEITKKLEDSISPLTVKKHLILALKDLRTTLNKTKSTMAIRSVS